MSLVERSVKRRVIRLTDEEWDRASALLLERDDAYARFSSARDRRERMFQELAGANNDYELDAEGRTLIVTVRGMA